ncbi:hypothetical protein AG1IA_07077 [Rhizoctonia solani AG-1 IA]|uniref:Uncharacterized protein n=1 Tax=Thanatephorus cucumeris (strain AG1-IA) TaxID=983506 RepID=L8WQ49_THACA|nr:hypothetical protein AG1IA_07077 [Rhizoctonia solani AG-1 IA]
MENQPIRNQASEQGYIQSSRQRRRDEYGRGTHRADETTRQKEGLTEPELCEHKLMRPG